MTRVYTHPEQPQMQVEVILASVGKDAPPIYTIRTRYPRIIHGEVMTHRMFGRNARSSRAVPVKTMLKEIRDIPFVPWHWGKNQKGMQATEECNAPVIFEDEGSLDRDMIWRVEEYTRDEAWLRARDCAVESAEAFTKAGYHKQVVNRLIEPFSWIDTLITATGWKNFLHLRQHKDAEPHLQDLANLVAQALDDHTCELLAEDEWHLPYITREDRVEAHDRFASWHKATIWLRKISAARCARISYAPFDGDAGYDKELERYNLLVTSERVHASPLEHQAAPDTLVPDNYRGPFWLQPNLHGNLTGWRQARKLIEGEAVYG